MKIKMLVSMAGHDHALSPGDEVDRPAAEARRLIDAGFAEAVMTTPPAPRPAARPTEKATQAKGETRTARIRRAAADLARRASGTGKPAPADPAP